MPRLRHHQKPTLLLKTETIQISDLSLVQELKDLLNSACMALQNGIQDPLLSDQDPHHDRIEGALENKTLDDY